MARTDDAPPRSDRELLERALAVSGLSVRAFAREVLHDLRTEGAVRAWRSGGHMPPAVRDFLRRYLAEQGVTS